MTCEQVQENLELYALGALQSNEAEPLRLHLASGCEGCAETLQHAMDLNVLISRNVPMTDPPAQLARRIREAVAPHAVVARRKQWVPWAFAAAALLLIGLGVRQRQMGEEARQNQLADQVRVSSALEILGAPGTRAVPFSDSQRPELHGALYVHQKLGLALIIDRLPDAPAGWKYESWIVSKAGAMQLVSSFQPDVRGRAVSVVPGPIPVTEVEGVAVSMEPDNATPLKPTKLLFKASI